MAEPKSFHFLLGAFILLKKDKKKKSEGGFPDRLMHKAVASWMS